MLDRILIPLDGTKNSERVLPFATLFAQTLQQPTILLSVLPKVEYGDLNPIANDADAILAEMRERQREFALGYLSDVRARLEHDGVAATTVLLTGAPAVEIASAAKAHDAGVIVMATHGRVGPERWFLGSVADRVLRTAPVPVLLLRPREGDTMPEAVHAIVVPLDGSKQAEMALPYAVQLAKAFKVGITLVRTQPMTWAMSAAGGDAYGVDPAVSGEVIDSIVDESKAYLAEKADWCSTQGIVAITHFALYAGAAAEIEEVASKSDALVVMTTRARAGLGRAFLGSVADKVVRSSGAPVLVIHPEE